VIDRSTVEPIDDFRSIGVDAFTTTRATGSFGTNSDEPVADVMGRWHALQSGLTSVAPRLATARQVHGARVVSHTSDWIGWLRVDEADGHIAPTRGFALAVTVADCVPVFIAHRSGVAALLHSGWKGTVAGILGVAVHDLGVRGYAAGDLMVHLGPSICGACYEVSPDVHAQLTGKSVPVPTPVDLRAILADQARERGVRQIGVSPFCTLCHQGKFYSHRGGDLGRQIGVLVTPA
jgi:YfiH family protein